MNRKTAVAAMSLLFADLAYASSVVWGGGELVDYSDDPVYSEQGYQNLKQWLWVIDEIYTKPNFFFTQTTTGSGVIFTQESTGWAAFSTHLSLMDAGDVVSAETMGEKSIMGREIEVDYGSIIYLGFETETYDPLTLEKMNGYGWVSLGANGDAVVVVDGAYGLDGDAMIVGGYAVPEPSGGLLLILGVAVLALKRKTREE